jgi:hypothetical protein
MHFTLYNLVLLKDFGAHPPNPGAGAGAGALQFRAALESPLNIEPVQMDLS